MWGMQYVEIGLYNNVKLFEKSDFLPNIQTKCPYMFLGLRLKYCSVFIIYNPSFTRHSKDGIRFPFVKNLLHDQDNWSLVV